MMCNKRWQRLLLCAGVFFGLMLLGNVDNTETKNLPDESNYEQDQGFARTGTSDYYTPMQTDAN